MFKQLTTALFVALLFAQGMAQEKKKEACPGPGYRQFDFWVGEWEVFTNGNLAGTSHVALLWNCVIEENWKGVDGSIGKSFNTYAPEKDLWTQVWVDNLGRTLYFFGRFENDTMLLEGATGTPEGKVWHRVGYYNNSKEGTVRQHWQQSKDAGETWFTFFDGLYRKKKTPLPRE